MSEPPENENPSIESRIERCLETVRPFLQADGGDLRMVRLRPEVGILEVQWIGTCQICPLSPLTLRAGVERAILHDVPEVRRVEVVP
jgi:Fe-S cluster biogenesis protein NfuA